MSHSVLRSPPDSDVKEQDCERAPEPQSDHRTPVSLNVSRADVSLPEKVRLLDLKPAAELTNAEQKLLERVYEAYG